MSELTLALEAVWLAATTGSSKRLCEEGGFLTSSTGDGAVEPRPSSSSAIADASIKKRRQRMIARSGL